MKPVKTVFTLFFFQYLFLSFSGIFSLTEMVLSSLEAEQHAAFSMDQSALCNCQCDLNDADHVCTCDSHAGHPADHASGPGWVDGFSCGSTVSYIPTEISSKYTFPVAQIPVLYERLNEFYSEHPVYTGFYASGLLRPPQKLS